MTVIAPRAKMVHKLSRKILKEIQAEARVNDMNPEDPVYEKLAERIARSLVDDVKLPRLRGQCLVADDDGAGGYKNPRIVVSAGSAEEVLYPEDDRTGEPVEDRIADYMLPLPDPEFLPEI